MFGFPRRHACPIAIDIGQESVKMLQLSSPGRSTAVMAASRRARAVHPGAIDGEFSDLLRQMLAEAPFAGRRAIAALPPEIVHTRTLRLPHEAVDLFEATASDWPHLFSFDLADAAVRFLHAGLVRQGGEVRREVIAIAARKDQIRAFHGELAAAGLSVESLQAGPIAIHAALQRLESAGPSSALLEIGAARSTLIISGGATLQFVKSFEIGGRDFEQAVAHRLSLDETEARHLLRRLSREKPPAEMPANQTRANPVASAVFDATRALAEDLAHQVSMCFRYHAITFRGRRPAQLLLAGGASADRNIHRALGAALGLTIHPMDPLSGIDTTVMRPADQELPTARWAMCLGLGLLHSHAALSGASPISTMRRAA